MRITIICIALIWFQTVGVSSPIYGFGGLSTGAAGSVTSNPETPFPVAINPAVLSTKPNTEIEFSTRVQKATGDGTLNWGLGFSYPFSLSPLWQRNAGIGVSLQGPYSKIRSYRAFRSTDFSSLRYGGSEEQLTAVTGASIEVVRKHLFLGAAASWYISASGNNETILNTHNPTGRLALDVSLFPGAILGTLVRLEPWRMSLVYRSPVRPTFEQSVRGRLDETLPIDQPFSLLSVLYYEPQTLETDLQYVWNPFQFSLGASLQFWADYEPAYLRVKTWDSSGNEYTTTEISPRMRNTLNPRASITSELYSNLFTTAGYQFRPYAVTDLSGPANWIDTSTHVLGLNIEYCLHNPGGISTLNFSTFGQWHIFNPRTVTKSDPSSVGAPGYVISGNAYAYGVLIKANL